MKLGIKHQVLLLALVPTITISVLLGTYFISTRLQDLEHAFRSRGEAIVSQVAPAAEYGVFSQNKYLLERLAEAELREHHAEGIAFYSAAGKVIASSGKLIHHFTLPKEAENPKLKVTIHEYPHSMAFVAPIAIYKESNDMRAEFSQSETIIGWLMVELETESIHMQQLQILLHAGLIFLLGLTVSGYYAFHMGRNVTRPILRLAETVERIKQGALNTRVQVNSYREIDVLGSGINTMVQALENAHTELQRKIDQATLSLRRTLETIEVQNIELDIAKRTAEKANKIKSEFLADMSHEIRTPLNGVLGFINLLQKTELNQKQKEFVNTIQRTANNLLAILNDILDFSKIEAGKLRFEQAPMDIRECIDEILNLLAPHAHEKNIPLIPLVYSDVPTLMLGDPLRIKQIITNLVSNSIKFTSDGSVVIRVLLEQETPSHYIIRVSVSDTGIGLSKEEQKVLFQAFNQTKSETTRKFGGSGLGLVISKKLVEQMGGSIGVESEPEKGSTFWFTYKAKKYTENTNPSPQIESASNEMPAHSQNELNLPISVLVVEDNEDNAKLLAVLLGDMGIEVKIAYCGSEAIQIIRQQAFQLILMDIRMPDMSGIETSQAIRTIESNLKRSKTPIIVLTAYVSANEKNALLSADANDYLTKPISETDLKNVIKKWAGFKKPARAIDWELGKTLAGGRLELATELLGKLAISLPDEKTKINEQFLAENWQTLRDQVHKLHGACCYCGVPRLKECAQLLENAIESQSPEIIQPHLDAFNQAIDDFLNEVSG